MDTHCFPDFDLLAPPVDMTGRGCIVRYACSRVSFFEGAVKY